MIPGPYVVCRLEDQSDDSDGFNYISLRWGYDSVLDARGDFQAIADQEGVSPTDLCVIRVFGPEETEE